ncbi:hypothetical protein ACNKHM_14000 [Shigella sonnei]
MVNWVAATGGRPATEHLNHCADASANAEEFGKILLKVQQDGSQVLLRDVARVELGRKILPPWRAITANLLPGSPSNWLPEQTPWIPRER